MIGTDDVYDMVNVFGASLDTAVVNTVASGTEIIFTKTAGGLTICWVSGRVPAGGFTLTSTFLSAWLRESNMNANAGGRFRVFRYRPGTPATLTELGGGPFNDGVEFGTGSTEMTWTGNVTDSAFLEDDRLVVKLYITNVGTMGGNFTCTLDFNAASAATGDSFFQIAETVTFKDEPVPLVEMTATGATWSVATAAAGALRAALATGLSWSIGGATLGILKAMQATGVSWSASVGPPPAALRGMVATGASWSIGTAAANAWRGMLATGSTWSLAVATAGALRAAQATGATWSAGTAIVGILKNVAATGASWSLGSALTNIFKGLTATGVSWSAGAAAGGAIRDARATGASWSAATAAGGAIRAVQATGASWTIGTGRLARLVGIQATGATWSIGTAPPGALRSVHGIGASWSLGLAALGVRRAIAATGSSWSIGKALLAILGQGPVFTGSGVTWSVGIAYLDTVLRAPAGNVHAAPYVTATYTNGARAVTHVVPAPDSED